MIFVGTVLRLMRILTVSVSKTSPQHLLRGRVYGSA